MVGGDWGRAQAHWVVNKAEPTAALYRGQGPHTNCSVSTDPGPTVQKYPPPPPVSQEHANDTATHVELPQKKIWYSETP